MKMLDRDNLHPMTRPDLKDCRMMVAILLPKGADVIEAFRSVPDTAIMAGDYIKEDYLGDEIESYAKAAGDVIVAEVMKL